MPWTEYAAGELPTEWTESVEPIECEKCRGLSAWWDLWGNLHCMACEPPEKSREILRKLAPKK